MKLKQILMGLLASATFATGAQAATVCNFCDYVGPAGTYLGAHDATTNDLSTFEHFLTTISSAFTDHWVFDIAPLADASASADFTALAAIAGFTASLYADGGGTTCGAAAGSGCGVVTLGSLLATDSDPSPAQWEIFATLAPGRYIIKVDGTTNADGDSTYTGQINFEPGGQLISEPGTLALLGLGLLAGALGRRQRRQV
jgi:hypothetical protein